MHTKIRAHASRRRSSFPGACAALLFPCLPGAAFAHTGLHTSAPADGATVPSAPAAIELEFHGDVRLIRLTPVQEGTALETSFDPGATPRANYSVPVSGLRSGEVTVEWAAIGEDGHTVTGAFTFTVAEGDPKVATP